MRRWAFNFGAAVSLLLCVNTAVLGVWSALTPVCVQWRDVAHTAASVNWRNDRAATNYMMLISHGNLSLSKDWNVPAASTAPTSLPPDEKVWDFLGLRLMRRTLTKLRTTRDDTIVPGGYGRWDELTVSLAWPLLIGLPMTTCLAVKLWGRRHRSSDTGLCASCGYDLRATLNRCPECGTVPQGVRAGT